MDNSFTTIPISKPKPSPWTPPILSSLPSSLPPSPPPLPSPPLGPTLCQPTNGTTWDRGSISRRGSLEPGASSLGSHAPSRKASLVSSVGSQDTDTDDPDTEPEEVPEDEPGAVPGELPEPVAVRAAALHGSGHLIMLPPPKDLPPPLPPPHVTEEVRVSTSQKAAAKAAAKVRRLRFSFPHESTLLMNRLSFPRSGRDSSRESSSGAAVVTHDGLAPEAAVPPDPRTATDLRLESDGIGGWRVAEPPSSPAARSAYTPADRLARSLEIGGHAVGRISMVGLSVASQSRAACLHV